MLTGFYFMEERKMNKNIESLTPLQSIREYCRQCSAYSPKEIKLCPISGCPLYPLRFGRNPKRKGVGPSKPAFINKHHSELSETTKEEVLDDQSKSS